MDSVTSRIFSDPALSQVLAQTLASMVKDLLDTRGQDPKMLYTCRYFRYDLKYIAKPDLMPLLVQDTSVLEDLIEAVHQLHFADVQKNTS